MCNHNAILGMLCHESCENSTLLIATNILKTCSFRWFVCTNDDVLVISPHVFLPNSPLIASRMMNNLSIQCFECNNERMFRHEMDTIVFSYFHGVFVFPHLEDAQPNCLHIDLAYALLLIYLCCANGVVNKNGHVIDDVLLYHAHTYFAWSLLCEGTYAYSSTSTEHELTKRALESYLRMRFAEILQYRHFAKVNSIHLNNLGMIFENWLLFECCFAFLVSFLGIMKGEGTIMSCHIFDFKNDYNVDDMLKSEHLPPRREHGAQESRSPLFEGGGDDAAQPPVDATSCTSSSLEVRILKSDVREAW